MTVDNDTKKKNNEEQEDVSKFTKSVTTWIPITISVLGLALGLLANSTIGSVEPIKPAGYGMIRNSFLPKELQTPVLEGIQNQDNIMLPITWKNTTGSSILLEEPRIALTEVGQSPQSRPQQSSFLKTVEKQFRLGTREVMNDGKNPVSNVNESGYSDEEQPCTEPPDPTSDVKRFCFILIGEYPNLSSASNSEAYTLENTILLE